MCQVFQENYANFINGNGLNTTNNTSDVIPSLVLFSDSPCAGTFYPSKGGTFISNPFDVGQTIMEASWNFTVASFFIPFNFRMVVMTSSSGNNTSTFIGPYYVEDTSQIDWQFLVGLGTPSFTDMRSDPIGSIFLNTVLDWQSGCLLPMCMGSPQFIGPYVLSRFFPQTARCDAFMTNTWCAQHLQNTECGCFAELPAVQAKALRLQVNLPLICFGEQCALTRTYKTNQMMSQSCNLTICQQTINQTKGIIDAGQDIIFCGGSFFNSQGTLPVLPTATPLPAPVNPRPSEEEFYTWIILGVAAVLFILVIYLLFNPIHKSSSAETEMRLQRIAFEREKSQANKT